MSIYNITYHEHFVDDDGFPNEKTTTVKVNSTQKEWYISHDGKPNIDGSIFYIWNIEEVSK